MKFIVQWNGLPTAQPSAVERFMKTGGALPPDGITMLGRWHSIGELSGCAIVESDSTAPWLRGCCNGAIFLRSGFRPPSPTRNSGQRWVRFWRRSEVLLRSAIALIPRDID